MEIFDVDGEPLKLTKTYLQQPHGHLWRVYLKDIIDGEYAILHRKRAPEEGLTLKRTSFSERTIGCRRFDKKTWAQIRAAMKGGK